MKKLIVAEDASVQKYLAEHERFEARSCRRSAAEHNPCDISTTAKRWEELALQHDAQAEKHEARVAEYGQPLQAWVSQSRAEQEESREVSLGIFLWVVIVVGVVLFYAF